MDKIPTLELELSRLSSSSVLIADPSIELRNILQFTSHNTFVADF